MIFAHLFVAALVPPSVVPVHRNIHAIFTPEDGKDIVQRWKPYDTLHPSNRLKQYLRMLIVLRDPEVCCICQHNTLRGLVIFAVDLRSECVIAHMENSNLTRSSTYRAICDLQHWLEERTRQGESRCE